MSFLVLVGPSGSGKSAALLPPKDRDIECGHQTVAHQVEPAPDRGPVAVVREL
ncbi:hypothetical protein [Amycolatopsis sp. NPDC049159]|uniref:hypothetical protein n=1 Tax=Amycolatopsis sp. NPDC049159 TaxID=3157210 RepID=UPI00340D5DD6